MMVFSKYTSKVNTTSQYKKYGSNKNWQEFYKHH